MRKIFKPFIALALIAVLVLSSCYGHSHNYRLVEEVKASCEQDGVVAHYECDCGKYFDLDHNEITNIAISKLGHDLKHVEAKAATCTEAGNYEYWHCERCGKNYTSQDATTQITTIVVPALGHEYELKTVWNDDGICLYELECEHDHSHKVIEGLNGTITHTDDTATCTSAGSVTYTLTLTYDGKTYTDTHTVQTGALEHDWKWVIDKEATATEDGVKHEECSRCGETRNEGTVIPHAHTHELQMVQGQSATETEAGFKAYYSCSCGKFFEDAEAQVEIADLAAWKAQGGRGYVAPTGATPHQHSFTTVAKVDATETTAGHEAYYVCSSCGKAYTAENDESTLIEDLTAWLAEGGAGYIAPVPHQHDLALVLMLPATETEAGYKAYYTCSCGKYFEDAQGEVEIPDLAAWKAEGGRGYIAPTGVAPHQHELALVQGKEATTTEAGYKAYYECSCGKFFEDEEGTKEIADLDAWKAEGGAGYLPVVVVPHTHEYTKVEAKAASCTEDGNIEYYTCNVEGCGKLFTKSGEEYTEVTAADVVISATGHSYGEWSVATLPSANATGLATRECATCHHVDELTLPVVNEENYTAVVKTPATCGAKGVHTYTLKENTKISFDLEDIEISGQHGELQSKEVSTKFEFTSKSWGDFTKSWTSGKDGHAFETGRGVQITTGATGANVTTKEVFEKVTKVVITYSTNASKGAGSISVRVSGDAGAIEGSISKTGGVNDRTKEFTTDGNSGTVKILVYCTENSIYIKSIEIFYSAEVRTLTKHEGFEPSCEIDGEKTYYECPICHKFFEDAEGKKEITEDIDTWKVIPELGHDFGTPTYSWNGGYCTATRVCKNDERHVETETVLGTEVKDTVETCTTNATGHLVATFENPAFESQSTEADSYVFENSALGHNYNNTPSRYSYSEDKWFAEYDCTRCDHVKKEETTDVKVAINNVGFATLQAAIDSSEDGDIRRVKDSEINEAIKLTRDVKFVSLYYNGDFDFNGHTLLLEGEVDKISLKVSKEVTDETIKASITVVGKKVVIDRTGEKAVVTFELDGQAVTIHKDGTHTAYQTLEEAIAAFDGALDEVIKLNAPLTANGSITITNTAVLDFETHDVTATSLIINDGVVFTVFNGKFLGLIDENDLMTGKLVIKAGYHVHVIEGGFDIHKLENVNHYPAVAPTCTEDGNIEYWECDYCEDKFSDAACTTPITNVVSPKTGHTYGTPTYVWADDHSTCTATVVCTKCTDEEGHTVTETVDASSVVTREKTCELTELSTFTATFTNPLFTQQVEENVKTAEALGHSWTHIEAKAATEEETGKKECFECSVCHEVKEYSNNDQETIDAIFALAKNKQLDDEIVIIGEIDKIVTEYSVDYNNITVNIIPNGFDDKIIKCFRLVGGNDLNVHDVIRVKGIVKNYNGTIEFDSGSTYDIPNMSLTLDDTIIPAKGYSITYMDGDNAFAGIHEEGYPTKHFVGTSEVLKSATKTGYTLEGWYTDSSLEEQYKVASISADAKAVTLYAKWTANKHTVTFKTQDGSAELSSNEYDYATAWADISVPQGVVKAETNTEIYTFVGWATSENQTAGELTPFESLGDEDVVLYAAFSVATRYYTVRYLNGEDVLATYSNLEYEDATPEYTSTPTKDSTAAKVFTFAGWDKAVSNKVTASVDYVAVFNESTRQYNVVFALETGVNPIADTKVNYNFEYQFTIVISTGYDKDTDFCVTVNDVDVTSQLVNDSYTIEHVVEDLEIIVTGVKLHGYSITYMDGNTKFTGAHEDDYPQAHVKGTTTTLKTATKTGYTFVSWQTRTGEGTELDPFVYTNVSEIAAEVDENIVLYAKWSVNTYKLSGVSANGVVSWTDRTNPITEAEYDSVIHYIITPNPGYEIAKTEDDLYLDVDYADFVLGEDTATLQLPACTLITYTIIYTLNGGTNSQNNPTTYNVNSETITLEDPTKEGYTFNGWTGSNGETPAKGIEIVNGSTGDKTYTANWTANTYNVVFNSNGATGSMANQTFTYDVAQNLTANSFAKAGYTFAHWNTKADGNGTNYNDSANVSNLATSGDFNLYAIWTLDTYNITYTLNGGTNSQNNPTTYNVNSETITLEDPTKAGHTFGGWYTDALFTAGNEVTEISNGSTGNKALFAKFTINSYVITITGSNYTATVGESAFSSGDTLEYGKTIVFTASNGYIIASIQIDEAAAQAVNNSTKSYVFDDDKAITITVNTVTVPVYKKYTVSSMDEFEDGDYVIYYDGHMLKNTISSDRAGYEEIDSITNEITNPKASVIWHISKNGNYWTIYNVEVGKYLAGTGVKNKVALYQNTTENNTNWTINGDNTFEIINIANEINNVNKNLRSNGTSGFACYSTSTGGALTLYKLEKNISSIEVKTNPTKTCYISGENFDPSGLEITINYEDNTTKDITYAENCGIEFSPETVTAAGNITISYGGKSATVSVTINELDSIVISGSMTKTSYGIGSAWNPAGLVVTAIYAQNDFKKDVTGDVVWSYNPTTPNSTEITSVTVTATYQGKSDSNTVDVTVVNIVEYTITFDANAGGDSVLNMPNNGSVEGGNNYNIPTNVPTRSGYKFVGWNTQTDGKGTTYLASTAQTPVVISNVSENISLHAIWNVIPDPETIVFSEKNLANNVQITSNVEGTNISISFSSNGNGCKYYNTGSAVRIYGGNSMTISSSYEIKSITITFATGEGSNTISSNVGTYSNGSWTGSSTSITFSVGGTSGHRRIASITVSFE